MVIGKPRRVLATPVDGRSVALPAPPGAIGVAFLPADGAVVVDSDYWRRRVRDGVVTLSTPPARAAEAEEPTP